MDFFNKTEPILETVVERDIDLLILEEICVSESFRRFLFDKISSVAGGRSWEDVGEVKPKHSVSFSLRKSECLKGVFYENRETDIELRFTFKDPEIPEFVLFIEDKVNAPFTEEQAQSYLARVNQTRAEGKNATSMLIAPQGYIDGDKNVEFFEFTTSLERLDAFFDSKLGLIQDIDERRSRIHFKKMILEQSIEKWRNEGPAKVDEGVTAFRRDYDKWIVTKAPQLRHKVKGAIGRDVWVQFTRCLEGKKGISCIYHKIPEGKVDLHVSVKNLYSRWEEIRGLIEALLGPEMQLPDPQKKDKSFKVSLNVPVLQPYSTIQEERLLDLDLVIEAVDRLRQWHNKNLAILAGLQFE